MAEIKDTMDCLKKKAIEALEVYSKKENWKQEDLDGAKDAVKLYNDVCEAQMKDGIWGQMKGDWSGAYSGYNQGYVPQMNYGSYAPYSNHGMGNMSGAMTPHGNMRLSYGRMDDTDMSGARGRDMDTGQYVSMNAMYHDPRYATSGHSIKDRMIASLEQQMDHANTEYEREEIRKAIAEIERMKR